MYILKSVSISLFLCSYIHFLVYSFYTIVPYRILSYTILRYPCSLLLLDLFRDESQRVFDTAQAELKRIEVEVGGLKNLRALHAKVRNMFPKNVFQNILQNVHASCQRIFLLLFPASNSSSAAFTCSTS